jgi:SAM-dependent methyltransferase
VGLISFLRRRCRPDPFIVQHRAEIIRKGSSDWSDHAVAFRAEIPATGRHNVPRGTICLKELSEVDARIHWDRIYTEKSPNAVSWYTPHLETSLKLIEQLASDRAASIIDVGGGASTLVDDLLLRGYKDLTVLDISQAAIDASWLRLGRAAEDVRWIAEDVTKCELEPGAFDVWHDRAVFHFLTRANDRIAYVRQVSRAMKPGGLVIVSTFGTEGPTRCSGLDVVQYDAASLRAEFGAKFRLLGSSNEVHHTPFSKTQQFLFCWFRTE